MSSPGIEPGPRPSQSRVRVRHTPRTIIGTGPLTSPPTRESNPALRLRRPPCVRHTRGEVKELSALARSRTWSSTFGGSRAVRHTPRARAQSKPTAGLEPAGTCLQGRGLTAGPRRREQGRKDLNPVREFWRLAALPGAHPSEWPRPALCRCRGLVVLTFKRGEGPAPARAAGTGPSSRPGRRVPRRAASTRGGLAGAGASCRPAPGCGRPSWRCS
jgi:hypothetical protein